MMKTTKFGTLFLISIMALAGITAGYAIWQETLTISGTVNTGSFEVEMSVTSVGDDEDADKDGISWIEASVDGYTMTVTITNAYPCITYYVNFQIMGLGTVPAHFTGWDWNLAGMPASADVTITPGIGSVALINTQLHYLDVWTGKLEIHLDNPGTEELTTYTFTVSTIAHQYNEVPPE